MQNWLYTNLQKWTPFSVLLVLAGVSCLFVIGWDTINNQPIPPFILALFTLLIGSSGAATLFQHGVVVANGVAQDTARTIVQEQAQVSQPLPVPVQEVKKL